MPDAPERDPSDHDLDRQAGTHLDDPSDDNRDGYAGDGPQVDGRELHELEQVYERPGGPPRAPAVEHHHRHDELAEYVSYPAMGELERATRVYTKGERGEAGRGERERPKVTHCEAFHDSGSPWIS